MEKQCCLLYTSDISIFKSLSGNEYSNKNIEKTVKDYNKLQGINPEFQNSKWLQDVYKRQLM